MSALSPDVHLAARISDRVTFLICETIFKFSAGFTKISATEDPIGSAAWCPVRRTLLAERIFLTVAAACKYITNSSYSVSRRGFARPAPCSFSEAPLLFAICSLTYLLIIIIIISLYRGPSKFRIQFYVGVKCYLILILT